MLKRIAGIIVPVVIAFGVVFGLSSLKHESKLTTVEEKTIEQNIQQMKNVEQGVNIQQAKIEQQ